MTRAIPVAAAALVLLTAACARQGTVPPAPRALEGARVMLLPVRAQDPPSLDAELAFWLADRAPATEWVLPAALQDVVDRQPGWRVRLDALPRAIGDPRGPSPYVLDPPYGELRRLGAVTDVLLAVMPVSARVVDDPDGPVMELTAAVLDVRVGQVLWIGTVRGEPARGAARDGAAAVAEALARALFPS